MPGPDQDNPATLTGPSHRATGPAHRATGPVPGGVARPRVAQADDPEVEQKRRVRRLLDRTFHEIEAASHETPAAMKAARKLADDMMAELIPFYKIRLSRWAPRSRMLGQVSVRVVTRDEFFHVELPKYDSELLAEERALLAKFIPQHVSNQLSGVGRGPNPTTVPVNRKTKLTATQMRLAWPDVGRNRGTPGAFYSGARRSLIVRADQVDIAIVAHELCHAFASSAWNEFCVGCALLSIHDLSLVDEITQLDEGLASMLAQDVLDDWFTAKPTRGVRRPSAVPKAQVGYLPSIGTRALGFVQVVDGTLATPGAGTLKGYFGGRIVFRPNEAKPRASTVRVGGGHWHTLREILA